MRAVASALTAMGFYNNVRIIWRDCHTSEYVSMQWAGWAYAAINVFFAVLFIYLFGWVYP